MTSKYKNLKEEAFEANLEIPKQHLAIYTWGNVSALDRAAGVFAIKPSGVPYDKMNVDDMVIVDLDGRKVEGKLNPSSDTPTHAVLYRNFEGLGGICHTHSPYAVGWAQAGLSLPLLGTTHADHLCSPVPCTRSLSEEEVRTAYEENTGLVIVDTFRHPQTAMEVLNEGPYPSRELVPLENPMVLVCGHGPFAWGKDAQASVYNAAVLEEISKMALFVRLLKPDFKPLPQYVVQKHYERKHGKNAYYGQSGLK
jgi:L-ribulose-5-phosphate 4-epimerase